MRKGGKMIPLCIPQIDGNEWKYVKECLDTAWVSSVGNYVDLFEERFSNYLKVKNSIVTMNGTSAITLALQTLGIGPGDEVIVPSLTFIASVNPVRYVGAEPIFVDITPDTWVMDVDKIEALITHKTKAVIPVHLYGNLVDMEPLLKLAKKHNLFVVEDATEALGSEYRVNGAWHKAGCLGHFGTFSFNGNKLITTGAGGMLVTNDAVLAKRAKHLSTQAKVTLLNGGMLHDEVGYNYRMPNILAAMGVAQLEKVEVYLEHKHNHAKLYTQLLKGVKGIQLPTVNSGIKHCHWLFCILVTELFPLSRDELIEYLSENGVMSRPFFYPIHQMDVYKVFKNGQMDCTERISDQGINLPSSVGLSVDNIKGICQLIREI